MPRANAIAAATAQAGGKSTRHLALGQHIHSRYQILHTFDLARPYTRPRTCISSTTVDRRRSRVGRARTQWPAHAPMCDRASRSRARLCATIERYKRHAIGASWHGRKDLTHSAHNSSEAIGHATTLHACTHTHVIARRSRRRRRRARRPQRGQEHVEPS